MKWQKFSIMFQPGVNEAAHAAIKTLTPPGDKFTDIDAIIEHSNLYCVAIDAIYRYERARRARSIFRWFYYHETPDGD